MENVELHRRHRVQIALHHFERHPMARHIEHQPAPWKSRLVVDVNRRRFESILARTDQLRESFHAAQRSGHCNRLEFRAQARYFQSIGFVFAERRILGTTLPAFDNQGGVRGIDFGKGNRNAGLPRDPRHQASHRGSHPRVRVAASGDAERRRDRQPAIGYRYLPRRRHQWQKPRFPTSSPLRAR